MNSYMAEETVEAEKKDASDCDGLLERMPEMEAWHGVRFEHLTALYDRAERKITIYGEMRPISGCKLKHNTDVIVVVYDKTGRIVERNHLYVSKDKFYSFQVIELGLYDLTPKKRANIDKILVYPAEW